MSHGMGPRHITWPRLGNVTTDDTLKDIITQTKFCSSFGVSFFDTPHEVGGSAKLADGAAARVCTGMGEGRSG